MEIRLCLFIVNNKKLLSTGCWYKEHISFHDGCSIVRWGLVTGELEQQKPYVSNKAVYSGRVVGSRGCVRYIPAMCPKWEYTPVLELQGRKFPRPGDRGEETPSRLLGSLPAAAWVWILGRGRHTCLQLSPAPGAGGPLATWEEDVNEGVYNTTFTPRDES